MADETQPFVAALTLLDDQLDGLEAALEPLFASSLEETLGRLDTPLDRAKLNVLIGYLMHDLVWSTSTSLGSEFFALLLRSLTLVRSTCCDADTRLVYLRAKGIDPAKHPVTLELVRR